MILGAAGRHANWWYLLVALAFPLFGWVVSTRVAQPINRLSRPISEDPARARQQMAVERRTVVVLTTVFALAGIVVAVLISYNA